MLFGELKENSSVALRSSACFVYLQTKEGFNLTCCLFYKLFCNEKGNISLSFIIIVLMVQNKTLQLLYFSQGSNKQMFTVSRSFGYGNY